jgi:hypothetical protein
VLITFRDYRPNPIADGKKLQRHLIEAVWRGQPPYWSGRGNPRKLKTSYSDPGADSWLEQPELEAHLGPIGGAERLEKIQLRKVDVPF